MLLTGTFARAVDDKLRIAIPKQFRTSLAGSAAGPIYLAPGTDGSIGIYSEAAFETLTKRLEQASPAAQEVRAFVRLFYARAQAVELDSQGRVRLPTELAQLASITKDAVLVGVGDHLELWNRETWETYISSTKGRFDELAESALK
jgi:MraZ protein